MVEVDPYELLLAAAGMALLVTTLGVRLLNRLDLPKFFVYFPVGLLAGPLAFGLARGTSLSWLEVLERVTEFAVIVSLLVAGLKIGRPFTWKGWHSTARLILLVMPLTIAAIALTGHWVLGLALGPAILLGAILAPTDPVLAGAVQLDRPADDDDTRFGLTSEAGLNDGFAFPFVYLGLYLTLRADEWPGLGVYWLLKDVLYAVPFGLAVGGVIGYAGGRYLVARADEEALNHRRRTIIPLGLLLVAYGVAETLGTYGFLAAFATGLGFRRAIEERKKALERFAEFSESIESLGEAGSIILLGMIFPAVAIMQLGASGVAVALASILLIRPLVVALSLIGARFDWQPRIYWAWFGIRGIGSLYYLSFAITFGLPETLAWKLFAATALVVVISNVLHGVSVYPMMRYARRRRVIHP